jgi:plastocyanin
VYPSQPGTSGLTFDGTQNGGFLSTGAFGAKGSVLPTKTTITFTKPGTYSYVCLFHSNGVYAPGAENMQGTITVQ